jgi:hypothetical protein
VKQRAVFRYGVRRQPRPRRRWNGPRFTAARQDGANLMKQRATRTTLVIG